MHPTQRIQSLGLDTDLKQAVSVLWSCQHSPGFGVGQQMFFQIMPVHGLGLTKAADYSQ